MSGNLERLNKNKFYFLVGAASMVYGILRLYDKATKEEEESELEDDGDYYWEPVGDNTDYQD